MEFEQIVKHLEWLDEEQRKSKAAVSAVEERLASIEATLNTLTRQVKNLSKQFSEISAASARLNQFDEFLAKQRADMSQVLADSEKKHQRREREAAKRHQAELEELNTAIAEMRSFYEAAKRAREDRRLAQTVAELKQAMEEVVRNNEENQRAMQAIEEGRRGDVKRLADSQGEATALRKRVEDQREKLALHSDALRNLEKRLEELFAAEGQRNQAQAAFFEQQAQAQVERERAWKDWLKRYEEFKKHVEGFAGNLQSLDETLRGAKRAQDTYVELNQKLERRISEITELQRLAEDRLRQEWVTFKAEDQKRWTGYTLSQDESVREIRRMVERLEERATELDDAVQTLQDQLHQTTDTTEQQLQELMNVAHEWLSAYERIMGHVRKPTR